MQQNYHPLHQHQNLLFTFSRMQNPTVTNSSLVSFFSVEATSISLLPISGSSLISTSLASLLTTVTAWQVIRLDLGSQTVSCSAPALEKKLGDSLIGSGLLVPAHHTPPATQQGIIGSLDCQDGAAIPVLWRGVSPNLCPVVMLGEYRY